MRTNFDEWIDRLSNQDETAFNLIYKETKNQVYAMIYSLVKNKPLTEDLMQDTYMKMLHHLHSFERGRAFTPWLLQIAKNLAYDQLRSHQRERVILKDALPVVDQPKPDIDFDRLVQSLDDDRRSIVLLRIVGDLSFKEIAKSEGKPLGTVYSLYQTAMKEIEAKLRKEARR
ncbi:MAG: RNA polymerase sigma factor [Bacillus subtilis]|nr:RNA polymerase sigma factor [Bacillus subtilis]